MFFRKKEAPIENLMDRCAQEVKKAFESGNKDLVVRTLADWYKSNSEDEGIAG